MAHAKITQNTTIQLNVFPLSFPSDAIYNYRIWQIDPIPSTPALREKIRSRLWKQKLKRPVVLMYQDERFVYGVGEKLNNSPVEYIGEGDKKYVISPTNTVKSVNINQVTDFPEIELIVESLQFEISQFLDKRTEDIVKGHDNYSFLLRTTDHPFITNPRHQHRKNPNIDIFRGFRYRVIHVKEIGFCLVLDVNTTYVGHNSLADYISQGKVFSRATSLSDLTRWIYDYGELRKTVFLVDTTGKTIGDVKLKSGDTTYDYLISRYPELSQLIQPNTHEALIIYRPNDLDFEEKHYSAASSLLKPTFNIGDQAVRTLGDTPAFPPEERYKRIRSMVKYFYGIQFAGQKVFINDGKSLQQSALSLPKLLFASETSTNVLNPYETDRDGFRLRQDWGERKLEALQEHGPFVKAEFVKPFFIYPASFENDNILEDFLKITQEYCQRFGKVDFQPEMSSYRDEAHAADIIKKIQGIAENQDPSFILLGLPENPKHVSQVYSAVKTQLKTKSKCFSSAKAMEKYRQKRLEQYVLGNSLAMLVENGARPWGLAQRLNFDLHIGFDVARSSQANLMGATTLSGQAATDIAFYYDDIDTPECIPTKRMAQFTYDRLQAYFHLNGCLPQNVLFQRDGRWCHSTYDELRGIKAGIKRFETEYPGERELNWAAVEIGKSTRVPARIFNRGRNTVFRPLSGSFFKQNEFTGFLVTTGDNLSQGTSKPMRVEVVESSNQVDILGVLQDIFWLSQLNWSTPKKDISLPITLRFTDKKLERYALEVDDMGDDEDWDFLDDDEE